MPRSRAYSFSWDATMQVTRVLLLLRASVKLFRLLDKLNLAKRDDDDADDVLQTMLGLDSPVVWMARMGCWNTW